MPNFDEKTGIRYGVISPHNISSFALDDIYQNGTDPQYESAKEEFENGLKSAIKEFCDNNSNMRLDDRHIDIDVIMDQWNDHFENDGSGIMDYSDSEYDLHVSGDNFGIFVMRSPYYTYCRGCSPCAPGAGDLNSPITDKDQLADCMSLKTIFSAGKALCLGHEWFDQSDDQYSRKIPYRVFRVSDDTEVLPGDQS
ncbi:MAG: hypothetical protein M0Q91_17935 [Methanoregula sp.]|jgi:hypothetical protein|nr:hypothetical protein [Methanoregula sp.]